MTVDEKLKPCPFCGGIEARDAELLVERQRALSFIGGSVLVTTRGAIEMVFKDDDLDYTDNGYRTITIPASERAQFARFLLSGEREWFPHSDYTGEPMMPGEFRDPPETEIGGDA